MFIQYIIVLFIIYNLDMVLIVALSPFIILCVLMIKYKKPAYLAAPVTLITALLMLSFIWEMKTVYISASLIKSLFVSLEILAIVFFASLLINILLHESISSILKRLIGSISHDRRIQAILISWIFVSFIEGISGFGTPTLLAAPILISFGFSPLVSVTLSLLGDGLATIFGAVGTPILYGIVQGAGLTISDNTALISQITTISATIASIVGWTIPIFISCMLVTMYKRPLREGLEILPYMIMAWLCFFIPYLLSAIFFGPELPSIIGALVGGIILVFLTRKKVFVPKVPWRFPHEASDHSFISLNKSLKETDKVFLPFMVVIVVLIIMKFVPEFSIGISSLLRTDVFYKFSLSKSPVIAFAIASLVSWFYLTITKKEITESLKMASQKMLKVGIALFSMVALAQLFIYSGMNNIDFPSIPLYLAGQFSQLGKIWPIFAPIVGAFGAFVAGSATVSNLLFSSTHMEFGMMFGLSAALILALQTVGASLGNMVAIYNIVVASSVIKISEDQEGTIIKYNIVPLIIILVLVGLIGIIWQITS